MAMRSHPDAASPSNELAAKGSSPFSGAAHRAAVTLLFALLCVLFPHRPASAQNIQFTQGGSGSDNSLQIPIVAYPGRGASLPVTLNYSSNVWRLSHVATVNDSSYYTSIVEAVYGEHSTAGWKTSLDLPEIEWPKEEDQYYYTGKPFCFICGSNLRHFRVARLFVHMPDGSTHELRQSDQPYEGALRVTGVFYAVDGSRLRYNSTSRTTGTLYMPDGSSYALNGATAQYTDRHGNALNYRADTRKWTDTLGREIGLPLPANPQPGTYNYAPPGFSEDHPYKFIFKRLSDTGVITPLPGYTNPPDRKPIANHYLPNPSAAPTSFNGGNYPTAVQSTWSPSNQPSLFISAEPDSESPTTYVLGHGQVTGELFDAVVLAEVVLPNGLSYTFGYNIYGEIDKVVYPAGAYERFEYDELTPSGDLVQPYSQARRAVTLRQQSPKGDGSDLATWSYTVAPSYVATTAPDSTYSVVLKYDFEAPQQTATHGVPPRFWPFGFEDARQGLAYDESVYDKAPPPPPAVDTKMMLRRSLTEYEYTTVLVPPRIGVQGELTVNAYRNARPTKRVSLMLDTGGNALAKTVTYRYCPLNGSGQQVCPAAATTTGLDLLEMKETHFAEVAPETAKTGAIGLIPAGATASSTATEYVSDPGYAARHILGLVASVTLKDAADNPVSKTDTFYDEVIYPLLPPYGDLGDDANYVAPPSTLRGNPTTVRRYVNLSAGTYLETHSQFDQYGNPVNFWNERGVQSQKEYSADYRHAYLTKTTSAVPDPSGNHGSQAAFTSLITYEVATGAVLTTRDANNQWTTFSYKIDETTRDPLNRLRKVTRPDGSWTKTDYNDVPGNVYVHTESSLDATRSTHSYQFFDKLGRASRSFDRELGTNFIVSETRYDKMGRVRQISNPIRTTISGTGDPTQAAYWATTSQPSFWTTHDYDELGRVKKLTLPDDSYVTTEYVGVYTTVTDEAGRKRRQKTDALGRVVRVDEPDANSNLDAGNINAPLQPSFYEYDALGNVVRINQGLSQPGAHPENGNSYTQRRYFRYDALSRLTYEKQVEQAGAINDPVTGSPFWSRKLIYDETRDNISYAGLLTTAEDARHVSTYFYYDQLGRTYLVDYSDDTPSVRSKYDQARTDTPPAGEQNVIFYNKGQLTELTTDGDGVVPQTQQLYDYDLMGRTRKQQQRVGSDAYDLRYAYNLGGGLVSERYPSGRVVTYSFDDAGRLLSAGSGATAYASAMSYKPFGGLESMTLGNGAVYSMAYGDARMQLSSITLAHGITTLQKYEYKYGEVNMATGAVDTSKNNGQIVRIESTVGAQKLWQQRFKYDTLGRLTDAGEYRGDTGQQSYYLKYGYDAYGNRFQRLLDNPHDQNNVPTNPFPQAWVENGAYSGTTNRFTSGLTYDDAGNVIVDTRFRLRKFQYDANNRQKQSSNLDDSGAMRSVYDGAGRRVATVTASGQVTRLMVYDAAGDLVAEYGGAVSTNGTQYVMGDQQGSTRLTMTSAPVNNPLVVARQDYLPFGEEVAGGVGARAGVAGYGQLTNPRQKYAGMEGDEDTGMSHTLWREFEAMSARWTAPDPYGGSMDPTSPQSFNRYTYVNNDPVNKVDPAGLMLSDIGVVQTNDAGYAQTLQGASDAAWMKEINMQYAAARGLKVVTEQVAGGTRYSLATRQQVTNAAFVGGMAASGAASFTNGFFDGGTGGTVGSYTQIASLTLPGGQAPVACNPNFFEESATFTIGARTVTGADLNVAARLIYAESSSAFSKIDGEYIGDRVNDERNAMASVLWNLLSPKTPTFKDVVYSGLFNAATTTGETAKFDGSDISTGAYRRLTERTINAKGNEGGGDCNNLRGSVDAMRRLQRNGGPFYDFNRWRGGTTPLGNSTAIGGSRFGYAGITITSKKLGAW